MSNLIKTYSDELNSVYEQIENLWKKADENYCLSDEFNIQLSKLYNRKAALKAIINDLK